MDDEIKESMTALIVHLGEVGGLAELKLMLVYATLIGDEYAIKSLEQKIADLEKPKGVDG